MIFNLFRKSTAPDAAYEAYRSIVAQSRQPRFYADWGVPDSPTGRFNMIALHMGLLLHRLGTAPEARGFTQALVDLFFLDMDRSHRELGVTDLGVPAKVRRLGDVFYGLINKLGEALDADDRGALEAVLTRNVFAGVAGEGAAELARYLFAEWARLGAEPTAVLIAAPASA